MTFQGPSLCHSVDVPPEAVIPAAKDFAALRSRMTIVVVEVLLDILPWLDALPAQPVLRHDFSKEMDQKSELFTLGTVAENPSSNAGVIKIMEHLQKYSPKVRKLYMNK